MSKFATVIKVFKYVTPGFIDYVANKLQSSQSKEKPEILKDILEAGKPIENRTEGYEAFFKQVENLHDECLNKDEDGNRNAINVNWDELWSLLRALAIDYNLLKEFEAIEKSLKHA